MDVIQVVDVPAASSADEAQRLLNAPCAENRYSLVQVLQMPGGAARAVYRLRVPRAVTARRSIHGQDTCNATVIQERIERVLKSKGPLGRNMLYKLTNGRRTGRANWERALDGMVQGQRAETDGKLFWAQGKGWGL